MATEMVRELIERCDPTRLNLYDGEEYHGGEAELMVPYLTESRSKQKPVGIQLLVLDELMQFLETLASPAKLLNEPCPPNPSTEAYASWKNLKTEYREGVQQVEELVSILQDKMERLNQKRDQLTQLVTVLEKKKELSLQVAESLQMGHNALCVSEGRLAKLRAETDAALDRLTDWLGLRNTLQRHVEETQAQVQCRLLSQGPSQLFVELRPFSHAPFSGQLEPLKLTITWVPDDHFVLQVFQGAAGLLEVSMKGRLPHLSAALLEVMHCYSSQGDMLAEIQCLHSRFAIDWRPALRLLVFLKTSSVVCSLEVEEGYPTRGVATLLSVRRDGELVDKTALQPPQKSPSLTDWLEFLSSSPDV
ncbi:hypothetical protein UPYG_G00093320 [Umbra pygmaea]|uniref:Uncharacterized protein n=1 Tax=Umbra pygmaea TaxID=75934 RepID=A0ABD0WZA3_UMBPY